MADIKKINNILDDYCYLDSDEETNFSITLDPTPTATVTIECIFNHANNNYSIRIVFDGDNNGNDAFELFTHFEAIDSQNGNTIDSADPIYNKMLEDEKQKFEEANSIKTSNIDKAIDFLHDLAIDYEEDIDYNDMEFIDALYEAI